MTPCHGTVLHDVLDCKRAKIRNEMTTDQKIVKVSMAVRIHPSNQSMNYLTLCNHYLTILNSYNKTN
jgi:hypothetical protein